MKPKHSKSNGRPTQRQIARELGLAPSRVSVLRREGMPVTSADAARAWRERHLHPGRVKNDAAGALRRAGALAIEALAAVQAGEFESVAGALRRAMRAIPSAQRSALMMPTAVWKALVQDVLDALGDDADAAGQPGAPPMSDAEASEMGEFWYGIASAERPA